MTVPGVISRIPIDISGEEIEADIESEFPIISVRRLTNGMAADRADELPKQVRILFCRSSVWSFYLSKMHEIQPPRTKLQRSPKVLKVHEAT